MLRCSFYIVKTKEAFGSRRFLLFLLRKLFVHSSDRVINVGPINRFFKRPKFIRGYFFGLYCPNSLTIIFLFKSVLRFLGIFNQKSSMRLLAPHRVFFLGRRRFASHACPFKCKSVFLFFFSILLTNVFQVENIRRIFPLGFSRILLFDK